VVQLLGAGHEKTLSEIGSMSIKIQSIGGIPRTVTRVTKGE
jgi:hypothetical protein